MHIDNLLIPVVCVDQNKQLTVYWSTEGGCIAIHGHLANIVVDVTMSMYLLVIIEGTPVCMVPLLKLSIFHGE